MLIFTIIEKKNNFQKKKNIYIYISTKPDIESGLPRRASYWAISIIDNDWKR